VSHTDVTMVRVYLTEHEGHLKTLLKDLHDRHKVRGVTVFRGIAGFGKTGVIHGSSLVDLSLDLPLVLEFFDLPEAAAAAIAWLETQVGPGCIVSWQARVSCDLENNAGS